MTSDLIVHGKELVYTEWGGTGFRTERCGLIAIWNRERPLAAVWRADWTRGTNGDRETGSEAVGVTQIGDDKACP